MSQPTVARSLVLRVLDALNGTTSKLVHELLIGIFATLRDDEMAPYSRGVAHTLLASAIANPYGAGRRLVGCGLHRA